MATRHRESESVERFIRDRQLVLMRRAIATLAAAGDDELQFQFHRLAGSLGTYQLHAAAQLLRELEGRAQTPSEAGASHDGLRAEAVSGLRVIVSAMAVA